MSTLIAENSQQQGTCLCEEMKQGVNKQCSVMFKTQKGKLKAHCRGDDWVNKTMKKNRNWQPSVISLHREIHEDDNDLTAFILETKYDQRA